MWIFYGVLRQVLSTMPQFCPRLQYCSSQNHLKVRQTNTAAPRLVWGEHWQQRVSLVLARGQASLLLGAVAAARNHAAGASGRKASPEFSETDCQPSVSL
jgi:hypothetical protein